MRSFPVARAAIFVAASATVAVADPDPEQVSAIEPRPTDPLTVTHRPEPTPAPDVTGAPLPGDESGRTDAEPGDSGWRRFFRGVLFVPKLGVDVVLAPVRGTVWAFDRYQLDERYRRLFFNDANTIGLYPTVQLETTFGLTVGARFVDRDVLGKREHFSLSAATGGQFRQIFATSLRTGNRLGDRFALELTGQYERRPRDEFFGIGNESAMTAGATLVDPRIDDTAVETRYRQQRIRGAMMADVRVIDGLHVRGAGELTDLQFGRGDQGLGIDTVYDTNGLVGYDGVREGYGELEVRWDDRTSATTWEPGAFFGSGSLAAGFAGRVHRLDGGPDYWRYGADLQHFFKIGEGTRVISTRLHGEAVTGTRDEVPFTELPTLGGNTYLRGYALGRFRDRIAAFGSIEYRWELSQLLSANLFVDAGRVSSSLPELSFDRLHVGYGVGVEGHKFSTFVAQFSVASSLDGGVFLNLSLNPVFDLDERVRRR